MVLDSKTRVVALVGGVGGAKLVFGLSRILAPDQFTMIGNVADDFELYGLHISPDLDTVMYTLAGVANPATGWGLQGETWRMLDRLRGYGEDTWFGLGDGDMATHILRTHWLARGMTLTTITGQLAAALGVQHRLLPVTDDQLATVVDTVEHGTLAFQEYFVRYQWNPVVKAVRFQGAEHARLTGAAAAALHEADIIVISPSNPVLSIAPLLAVPGMREALEARRGVCVAVSPFVGGKAVKGPAAKLMKELGLDISPQGLIAYYGGLLDGLVIDELDAGEAPDGSLPVLVTRTLMQSEDDKIRLATDVINWSESV